MDSNMPWAKWLMKHDNDGNVSDCTSDFVVVCLNSLTFIFTYI